MDIVDRASSSCLSYSRYITLDFPARHFLGWFVFFSPRLPGFQLLRDTFAGKILITFQNQFPVSNFLSDFYRQKCRAAAEILGALEDN